MFRDIEEKLITPDKLMKASDMAKVGCNDCKGCSDCCKDCAELIVLDEYDVKLLKEGLDASFNDLLSAGYVRLTVVDGVVLPALGTVTVKDKEGNDIQQCVFLNEDGRCRIHNYRSGICRMFPLARIYNDDGTFSYFLQEGECRRGNGVKIKISKWLGYPNIKEYEKAVYEYHQELVQLRKDCETLESTDLISKLQKKFLLKHFYLG